MKKVFSKHIYVIEYANLITNKILDLIKLIIYRAIVLLSIKFYYPLLCMLRVRFMFWPTAKRTPSLLSCLLTCDKLAADLSAASAVKGNIVVCGTNTVRVRIWFQTFD